MWVISATKLIDFLFSGGNVAFMAYLSRSEGEATGKELQRIKFALNDTRM